jgi:hypothetical protein
LRASIDGPKSVGQAREFTIKVDIIKQEQTKYQTALVVPPAVLEAERERDAAMQKKNVPAIEEDDQ